MGGLRVRWSTFSRSCTLSSLLPGEGGGSADSCPSVVSARSLDAIFFDDSRQVLSCWIIPNAWSHVKLQFAWRPVQMHHVFRYSHVFGQFPVLHGTTNRGILHVETNSDFVQMYGTLFKKLKVFGIGWAFLELRITLMLITELKLNECPKTGDNNGIILKLKKHIQLVADFYCVDKSVKKW